MGLAYRGTLAKGETFTTIESKINFLRPVWNASLRTEARVVRAGRIVGLVECDIVDERQWLRALDTAAADQLQIQRFDKTLTTIRPRPIGPSSMKVRLKELLASRG
jgi:hypothetical protein